MARKITCDPCEVKGVDRGGVATLIVGDDEYDLCSEHLKRFRAEFRKLFGKNTGEVKNAA
ncbi:hypothetical protein [Streptomyces sp. NPDC055036]